MLGTQRKQAVWRVFLTEGRACAKAPKSKSLHVLGRPGASGGGEKRIEYRDIRRLWHRGF